MKSNNKKNLDIPNYAGKKFEDMTPAEQEQYKKDRAAIIDPITGEKYMHIYTFGILQIIYCNNTLFKNL